MRLNIGEALDENSNQWRVITKAKIIIIKVWHNVIMGVPTAGISQAHWDMYVLLYIFSYLPLYCTILFNLSHGITRYGSDEILILSYYITTVTLMKSFVNIPNELKYLLLPDKNITILEFLQITCTLHTHSGAITTMRVLMSMHRENLLFFIDQSDGFLKKYNQIFIPSIGSVTHYKCYVS